MIRAGGGDDWLRRRLPPEPGRRRLEVHRAALVGLAMGTALCGLGLLLWGIATGVGALVR